MIENILNFNSGVVEDGFWHEIMEIESARQMADGKYTPLANPDLRSGVALINVMRDRFDLLVESLVATFRVFKKMKNNDAIEFSKTSKKSNDTYNAILCAVNSNFLYLENEFAKLRIEHEDEHLEVLLDKIRLEIYRHQNQ